MNDEKQWASGKNLFKQLSYKDRLKIKETAFKMALQTPHEEALTHRPLTAANITNRKKKKNYFDKKNIAHLEISSLA